MKRGLQFKGPKRQGGWIQFVAAGISIMSAMSGAGSAKKARKEQERQNEAQRKINRLKNKQAKRAYLRQFRQAQAAAMTAAIGSGVGLESSAFQGMMASQGSQAVTAVNEFQTMDKLGGEMAAAMSAQSKYQFQSQMWGTASNIAQQYIAFNPKSPTTTTGAKDVSGGAVNNTQPGTGPR